MVINKSPRLAEIDVAKGIGIILVVIGHNALFVQYYPLLKQAIYSFHLPLFFFLSGLVFKPQQHAKALALKRMASLLKPYFIVLIAYEIFRLISGKSQSILPFLGILYGTGQSISITPLWFLPHLFLVILLSNFLINFFHNNLKRYAFIIFIICILIFGVLLLHIFNEASLYNDIGIRKTLNAPLGLPLSFDFIMISIAFFVLGYIYANEIKLNAFRGISLWFSIAAFIAINLFLSPSLDLNSRIYDNPFPTTLAVFAGIWMTIAISKSISRNSKWISFFLSNIGAASLVILIFHGFVQGIFAHKFNLWFPEYPYVSIILSVSIAIIFSCCMFHLTNKYPKLRSVIQ